MRIKASTEAKTLSIRRNCRHGGSVAHQATSTPQWSFTCVAPCLSKEGLNNADLCFLVLVQEEKSFGAPQ